MGIKISNLVDWIGKVDWELNSFHGDEYSTHRGSSYNSFLIRDEKTVLVDTVYRPFAKEFVENLKREIDLEKIDYIVINHSEIDHSGALEELMEYIPNTPIYCTKTCAKFLRGHYHRDWNFVEVKTGDTLSIGKNELRFIEAKMLHWPDTMFTYLTGENILFSSDAFGQHYALGEVFADRGNEEEIIYEMMKYYANLLTLYTPMVKKKINEILSLNLNIDIICPGHGVVFRENTMDIINRYAAWSDNYSENQVTIVYDTMWNSTRRMAEAIEEGIRSVDESLTVKVMSSSKQDKNDIITEIFKSKILLLGSSTVNNGILYSTAGVIEMAKGLSFKNKKAAAFGSFGWSGECTKIITKELSEAGFEIINDGIKISWIPDENGLEECREFGREIARSINE